MATQEIICQRILHIPSMGVESISGTTLTPKSGYAVLPLKTQFAKITEKVSKSSSGPLSEQTLEIISNDIDADTLKGLENAHQIFSVQTNQGRTILFGNLDYPASFSSRENQLKGVRLMFTRTSINDSIL